MPIKVLSAEVAHKIAAGEVVERPASVVKELIENSLDAGATRISVEVRGGGLQLIRVSDNGAGIPAEEMHLAFQRHATSKIEALDDLESISTLGFRGEALPSIATVSGVTLTSRPSSAVDGAFIALTGGGIVEEGKRGCPPGTSVVVRGLFSNVPARLKFMKSPATEAGRVSELVAHYALAFPEVAFYLLVDRRTAFQTPGGSTQRDVLAQVYGRETAQAMLDATGDFAEIGVSGLVSPPSLSRASRSYISIFVNRRWVQSRMLSYAIEEAYHGMLMIGKHPIAIVNLSLPPRDVDVNVHPAKSEVRFRREQDAFGAVQRAVRAALTDSARGGPVPPVGPLAAPGGDRSFERQLAPVEPVQPSLLGPSGAPAPRPALPILRVVGQVANTYIIAEGPDGMYLVDQHAAHERVLFERLKAQAAKREVEVQGLLDPLAVQLTPRQEETLKCDGEALAQFGFAIEPFGDRTCLLRAVPAVLKGRSAAEAVIDLLDSLDQGTAGSDLVEPIAITLACRGAVRAGDTLTPEEMREMMRQLERTSSPRTCPHGRPTVLHLSSSRLEREFGRQP
ncbi:MAG: DNA mismatch repair endonuclease MutL [Chloroflexi bacterium]|nr:DNA mismatch repair endonuclease MutL [Chloroflexota bacterium]